MLSWFFRNFGPIIMFQSFLYFWGLKPAIVAALIFTFIEITLIKFKKQSLTPYMIFSFSLVIIFGAIDLISDNTIFFQYESAIFSLILAAYMGISMFRKKSILEELAEQQGRISTETYPDKTFFFRFMTSIWMVYFLGKSLGYYFISSRLPVQDFSLLRMIFGTVSFYILLGISLGFSRHIWMLLLKLQWMPSTRNTIKH